MRNRMKLFWGHIKQTVEQNKTSLVIFIRFIVSSALAFGIDLGLFTLIIGYFSQTTFKAVAVASFVARLVSSVVNYYTNRLVVFKKHKRHDWLHYYMLVVLGISLSSVFVYLGKQLFGFIPAPIVKVGVDGMLFLLSYTLQKRWVFKEKMVN